MGNVFIYQVISAYKIGIAYSFIQTPSISARRSMVR